MKKMIFCVLSIFCTIYLATAQSSKISKCKIEYVELSLSGSVTKYRNYKTLFFENNQSLIKNEKAIKDENPNISQEKQEKELSKGVDEQGREVIHKEIKEPIKNINIKGKGSKYQIYKDFKKNEMYSYNVLVDITDLESAKVQELIVKEKLPDFGWQITQEKKKIEDFECFKAISKPFRGRTYIAWFCPEIPISDGPWKLCGLPGLILEAHDEKGEVKFITQKVELQGEIEKPENKLLETNFPLITWEEYKAKLKDNEQKKTNYLKSKGVELKSMKIKVGVETIDD